MARGPFGFPRPMGIGPLTTSDRLITELENAIGDETSAQNEYQKLIDLLEREGYPDKADQVRRIQEQESRHQKQFKNILSEIRRERDA